MPHSESDVRNGLFLGLMAGTSADGIDAVLVNLEDRQRPVLLLGRTYDYPDEVHREVLQISQGSVPVLADRIARLDHQIGACFARAALELLNEAGILPHQVRAIGSHGQTLRHAPRGPHPFTWQLGDPNVIVERTGISTVADFRRRDVAAGGQGAPLLPALHAALFHAPGKDIAVLNLGGIANLSLLAGDGSVRGFDTGPANALMDAWIQRHQGLNHDENGAFAARGRTDETLLEQLLSDPFFALPPPKSSGRDHFHLGWLDAHLDDRKRRPEDVQATLLALTVRSVSEALTRTLPNAEKLHVCGGGVHNRRLMLALRAALPNIEVTSSAEAGLDPDFIEAMGFAWLASRTLDRLPGNLPAVTGASGPRILGAIHPA